MKLNLLERITLLNILPQEADYVTLKILNKLKETLSPSEDEFKEFEIEPVMDESGAQTGTKWNEKGIEERELEIGEKATDMIVGALKKLDTEKKLTNQHYSIYEKFIE